MRTIQETKTLRTYFKGQSRFGRTTTLVCRKTGELLIEVMGDCTRAQAYRTYAALAAR